MNLLDDINQPNLRLDQVYLFCLIVFGGVKSHLTFDRFFDLRCRKYFINEYFVALCDFCGRLFLPRLNFDLLSDHLGLSLFVLHENPFIADFCQFFQL